MSNTTKRIVSRRVLNVVIPFERTASGKLIGSVRIVTPKPYATDEFYTVVVSEEENRAAFLKETGNKSEHSVDTDMQSCDCEAYRRRRTCRHLESLKALRAAGKI